MSTSGSAPTPSSDWFKSSFSDHGGGCVEVRFDSDRTLVRDSKYLREMSNDPAAQPVIEIDAALWPVFLDVATGSASRVVAGLPAIELVDSGAVVLRAGDGTTLAYTAGEWDAFTAGIRAAEFAFAA